MARGQQKSVTGMRSGKAGGRRPSFNPAGAGKTLVRQMMLLPIMYIGSTMDWTATATFYAEATLLGVLVLGSLAIQVSIFLAQRKKEVAKVFDVGDATLMLDAEQINADGSVAAHAYDTAKLKMLRMQLIIAGVVVWFAHVRMGYQALSRGALTHTREWWTAGRATEPPRQPTRPGAAPRGQLWAGGAALGLQGSAHTPARRRREAPVGHHGCQPCPAVGREAKGAPPPPSALLTPRSPRLRRRPHRRVRPSARWTSPRRWPRLPRAVQRAAPAPARAARRAGDGARRGPLRGVPSRRSTGADWPTHL